MASLEEVDELYRNPLGVTADEDGPEGFVKASIVFPGLKKKLMKSTVPANGKVDIKYESRSFSLNLVMKNKVTKADDKYRYSVKLLPDEIDPSASYHKIKDDQVVVFLKKVKDRSWARELAESGLEAFDSTNNE